MTQKSSGFFSYSVGTLVSLILHVVLAFISILMLEAGAATATKQEVFSVTLEGGERLGGFSQAPKTDEQPKKIPKEVPDAPDTESGPPVEETTEAQEEVPAPEEEKKLAEPSVVEDVEKKAEEARLKLELQKQEEKKKKEAEDKKKKVDEEKKKKEEAKKKADADERKAAEEEVKRALAEKKAKQDRAKEFDKRLNQIRRGITQRYDGESANAGGQGIGAARIGGTGTGGGTLISVEKLAFLNALEAHVKSGWNWIQSSEKLTAVVRFQIMQTGEVQNVRLEQSSGNSNFDDSAIRAVRKASPVPLPPAKLFTELSDVRIIFDSKQ